MRPILSVEPLEDRSVPATFGIPWQDTSLTLSFAPDGTPTGGAASDLFDSLNQVRSQDEWQRDILRAYQAWVKVANVNVAVTPDSGDPLGSVGRWQGDARFGDVRLAGTDLGTSVLAVGTPADPGLAGTRAGDVLLNTSVRFDGSPYDLYSVMLHEAGHSLGLGNSANTNSVMYTQFNGTRTGLHQTDVNAVRALYGARPADLFERGGGNNSTARAFHMGGATAGAPDTVLLNFADLTTATDVDVFSFVTPGVAANGDHNTTVKIQSAGLSLVNAKLVVYHLENGAEKEVANATMNKDGYTGGQASVTFDPNDDDGPRRFYVKVQKADGTAFDVGGYALGVSFQNPADDDDFGQQDLNGLIGGPRPVLVNADGKTNNTRGTATVLAPTTVSTALPASRYEVLGSLTSTADADVYRVTAPAGTGSRVLTANVQTLSAQPLTPPVEVFDAAGNAVPVGVLASDSGLVTIQAGELTAGATYFVKVGGGLLLSTDMTGSYQLTADFGTQTTDVQTFASGQIESVTTTVSDTLYVAQPQVMHFLVSATADPTAPAGTGVRMVIRDGTGNVLVDLFAEAGQTVSGPGVLFRPGEYSVTIEAVRPGGYDGPVGVTVRGSRSTDPIGAVPTDPTFRPTYQHPSRPGEYIYPGNYVSLSPFYWLTLLR